ncbi:hypothetical protein ACJMK2_010758 [Sinanodonta woodiana]|uniref:ShKT domain-containing protein n=1 Tax=Sinanodonta woodiana TaxID=1069815 RepID=A0ABD3VGG1_SINWO
MPLNNEEKLLCFMLFSFLYGATLLEQTVAFLSPDWVIDRSYPPCEAIGLFSSRNCSYYDRNYLYNVNYCCKDDMNCTIKSTNACTWTTYEPYIMQHCRKTCQRCSQNIDGWMFYPQLFSLLLTYITTALLIGSFKFCRNDFLLSTTAVFFGVLYPISGLIEASSALHIVVCFDSGLASRLALASGTQSIIFYILTRIYNCKYLKDAKRSGTKHSEIFWKNKMATFNKWKLRSKWDHIKLNLEDIYTKAADETRIKP